MSWEPTTVFEREIVNWQPNHNFIYGTLSEDTPTISYPRPKQHLDYVKNVKQTRLPAPSSPSDISKLKIIGKVQDIAHTKPLGQQPTLNDWDNSDNVERENVAMMRYFGYGPAILNTLDKKNTLPTLPVVNDVRISKNGHRRMPVFLDERFFKMKLSDSSEASSSFFTCSEKSDTFNTTNYSVPSAESSYNAMNDKNTTKNSRNNVITYDELVNEDESLDSDEGIPPLVKDRNGNTVMIVNDKPTRPLPQRNDRADNMFDNNATFSISKPGKKPKQSKHFVTPKELYLKKRHN